MSPPKENNRSFSVVLGFLLALALITVPALAEDRANENLESYLPGIPSLNWQPTTNSANKNSTSLSKLNIANLESSPSPQARLHERFNVLFMGTEQPPTVEELKSSCSLVEIEFEETEKTCLIGTWDQSGDYICADHLEAGKGYFVSLEEGKSCEVPLEGQEIERGSINLHEGWNAIGANGDVSVSQAKASCELITIYFFDDEGRFGTFEGDILKEREGYLAYTEEACTIDIAVSKLTLDLPKISPSRPELNPIYFASVGEKISFDASDSYDPDGSIKSYRFDFGDTKTNWQVSSKATHKYSEDELLAPQVRIRDEYGVKGSESVILGIGRDIKFRGRITTKEEDNDTYKAIEIEKWISGSNYYEKGDKVQIRDLQLESVLSNYDIGTRIEVFAFRDPIFVGVLLTKPTHYVKEVSQNKPPTADFTYSPIEPEVEETINFQDQSSDPDGNITSWHWEFGDGNSSSSQNPSHTYNEAKDYQVCLTVEDNGGKTDKECKTIPVTGEKKPIAELSVDLPYIVDDSVDPPRTYYYVATNREVVFDASESHDPDGKIESYRFFFGNNTNTGWIEGAEAVHSYANPPANPPRYAAQVKVKDGQGNTDLSDKLNILVGREIKLEGEVVKKEIGGSKIKEIKWGQIVSGPKPSHKDLPIIKVGKGTVDTKVLSNFEPGTLVKSYGVFLTQKGTPEEFVSLLQPRHFVRKLENEPPNADFSYSPAEPEVGEKVTFDASDSSDSDGEIVNYKWDWNDDGYFEAQGKIQDHSFSNPGDHRVCLSVEDNDGAKDNSCNTVNLEEKNKPDLIITDIWWKPSPVHPGDEVEFHCTAKNQGEAQASEFGSELYIDGKEIDITVRDPLGAGDSRDDRFTYKWEATKGEHEVKVKADWENSVQESNEENNTSTETLIVEEKKAKIIDFSVEEGTYEKGEIVSAQVTVENPGAVKHTYFLGFSVQDKNGKWYDNSNSTGHSITLNPHEKDTFDVEWKVEKDAASGKYDALAKVWKESERDDLQTKLDEEKQKNSFEVESTYVDIKIAGVKLVPNPATIGEDALFKITLENVGEAKAPEAKYQFGLSFYDIYGEGGDSLWTSLDETDKFITSKEISSDIMSLSPGEGTKTELNFSVTTDVIETASIAYADKVITGCSTEFVEEETKNNTYIYHNFDTQVGIEGAISCIESVVTAATGSSAASSLKEAGMDSEDISERIIDYAEQISSAVKNLSEGNIGAAGSNTIGAGITIGKLLAEKGAGKMAAFALGYLKTILDGGWKCGTIFTNFAIPAIQEAIREDVLAGWIEAIQEGLIGVWKAIRNGLISIWEAIENELLDPLEAAERGLLEAGSVIGLHSPADIVIKDSQGRRTGYLEGEKITEIPNSEIVVKGHDLYLKLPEEVDNYTVLVDATDKGQIDLEIGAVKNNKVNGVLYQDVEVEKTTTLKVETFDNNPSGEMQVDEEGNGTYEETRDAERKLTVEKVQFKVLEQVAKYKEDRPKDSNFADEIISDREILRAVSLWKKDQPVPEVGEKITGRTMRRLISYWEKQKPISEPLTQEELQDKQGEVTVLGEVVKVGSSSNGEDPEVPPSEGEDDNCPACSKGKGNMAVPDWEESGIIPTFVKENIVNLVLRSEDGSKLNPDNLSVKVFDLSGGIVKESEKQTLNLADLANGIYLYTVEVSMEGDEYVSPVKKILILR